MLSVDANFYDVELNTQTPLIKKVVAHARAKSSIVIMSDHDLVKTPSEPELSIKYNRGINLGANIVKIVSYAMEENDNYRMLEFIRKQPVGTVIGFCMGEKSRVSRLLAPVFGSYLTFAAYEGQSAPGQIDLKYMKEFKELITTI